MIGYVIGALVLLGLLVVAHRAWGMGRRLVAGPRKDGAQ